MRCSNFNEAGFTLYGWSWDRWNMSRVIANNTVTYFALSSDINNSGAAEWGTWSNATQACIYNFRKIQNKVDG